MLTKKELCLKFGDVVRRLRTASGLSQEALADQAEVHRTYVGGIERGERNPTLTMIVRLAEALKVPPSKLLEDEAKQPEDADAGE